MPAAVSQLFLGTPLVCLVLIVSASVSGATPQHPTANMTSDGIYRDCSDLPSSMPSGVYMLRPGRVPFDVEAYCDMELDGGGWTVVIRRADIEPRENFYRDWDSYKWGIGFLEQEFYWGNEYLWMLTSRLDRRYQAHFWLEDWDGNTRHALYQNFVVESEAAHYKLLVGEYSGDAGDSFSYNNNYPFTTYDKDYDSSSYNCAERNEAGWWYKACTICQLTGKYYDGGYSGYAYHGILWNNWKNADPYSLKSAVMKIKPSMKS